MSKSSRYDVDEEEKVLTYFSQKKTRPGEKPPCRACTDFKSWLTANRGGVPANSLAEKHGCPPDRSELGYHGWNTLHSMAAYYPDKPTTQQRSLMTQFLRGFAEFYPCDHCAEDFRADLVAHPPAVDTRSNFSKWMCEAHNRVNVKMGKPVFDCNLAMQRWYDGWKDGSCDFEPPS